MVAERENGLIQLRVMPWVESRRALSRLRRADLPRLTVDATPSSTRTSLRYGYTSLTTPRSTFDYDMAPGTKTLLKRDEVLGGFDAANYQAERH